MKICVLGGLFDPPHNAHKAIAEVAIKQIEPDIFYFIPNGKPPQKNDAKTADKDRIEMIRLLSGEVLNSKILLYEMGKTTPSYTIETVEYLYDLHPNLSELIWLIGSDWHGKLSTWKDYDRLKNLCTFIVFERPNFPVGDGKKGCLKDFQPMDISSTDIRGGRYSDISSVVPESIANYIKNKGLYNVR